MFGVEWERKSEDKNQCLSLILFILFDSWQGHQSMSTIRVNTCLNYYYIRRLATYDAYSRPYSAPH